MRATTVVARRGGRGWSCLLVVLLGPLLLGGCRDATEPTEPDPLEKVTFELPRRLTFSLEDDRSPSWSADGRFIHYTAPGSAPFAETRGLLLTVPMEGGDARPALPEVQFPTSVGRWLTASVVSPDGSRLAYVEMWSVSDGDMCPGALSVQCTPAGADDRGPMLREVIFRVREPGSTNLIDAEPSVRVPFQGVTALPGGPTQVLEVEMHPFHLLFNVEESFVFRPSWSPDGQRLVFSDGLRLLIWEVGSDRVTPIPGTDDGVHPAWSPDGAWIAFTRLVRGDPIFTTCTHFTPLGAACRQERTIYPVEGRRITLIRPDGSESVELAEGEEPAWSPASDLLVYRSAGRVVAIPAGGGPVVELPGSEGGGEPAVSPDGTLVAFAKVGQNGSHDIWVTSLEQGSPP